MSPALEQQEPEIRVVAANLKTLGQQLRDGEIDLKKATELANVYGKELKAQQLILAERIFMKDGGALMLKQADNADQDQQSQQH